MSRAESRQFNRATSLKEVIAARKKQMESGDAEITGPVDPYEPLYPYLANITSSTVIGTAEGVMTKHMSSWDDEHPESPARWQEIMDRLRTLELDSRCISLEKDDTYDEQNILEAIELVHDPDLIQKLKEISETSSIDFQRSQASEYDGVYFNESTYQAALEAVKWTLTVVKQVLDGKHRNGFAIVRPPGHHAKPKMFEGYCYFNNVAIAAEKCIRDKYCKKIMIIDFDVHHGNGTQEIFYERNNVLFVSIHRYERGRFWPNLPDGDFHAVGNNEGEGYNVNIALPEAGLEDVDYMALVLNLIVPLAYEFQPELILISAGYDAALGCPEGRMKLTPGFYSHVVQLLKGIADSRIVMVLEGGYFPPSLAESVALSIKGLLGDPCPMQDCNNMLRPSVKEIIYNVKGALYEYWKCFRVAETFEFTSYKDMNMHEEHVVVEKYFGYVQEPPFETTDYYPKLTTDEIAKYSLEIEMFQKDKENYRIFNGVGYGYDPITLMHKPPPERHAFEIPDRLTQILEIMEKSGIDKICFEVKIPDLDVLEICRRIHDVPHIFNIMEGKLQSKHDLYISEHTEDSSFGAVRVLVAVVDAVMTNQISHGVALIRPPGHHACRSVAQGFCFLNNVAIAAQYARAKYKTKKVLIVDFDIHHGNGTQEAFYMSDEVLYISIHRFDNGNFYPKSESGSMYHIGRGPGEGFNVNIPFSGATMGNSEYLAAFLHIVLPIGYSFKPELVIVSAGFDAGINDPLGGYHVTPEMFGQFIYLLKPLSGGRIILALEGGYNLHTTSYSMLMCMKALLNQPIPLPKDLFSEPIKKQAAQTIREVVAIQREFWPNLIPFKKLSTRVLYSYHPDSSEYP